MKKYIVVRNEYDNGKLITFKTEESELQISKDKNLTFILHRNTFGEIMMTTKIFKLVYQKEDGNYYRIYTDNSVIHIQDREIFWKIKEYLELRLVKSDFHDWLLREEYE